MSLTAERPRIRLIPIGLGFLGASLVLLATSRYGVGLTPDLPVYLSAARNLFTPRGYSDFFGGGIADFPPLYPVVLAVIGLFWSDLISVARYFNAICFGLIVCFSSRWLLARAKSRFLALLGSLAILLARPLVEVSGYVWTEPLFILLTLLCLFQMERFARTDAVSPALLAGLYAGLAFLTRYVGVSLIITGIALLLLCRGWSAGRRLKLVLIFSMSSGLPVLLWFGRNLSLHRSFAGAQRPSGDPLEAVYRMADTLMVWLFPSGSSFKLKQALLLLLLIGFVYLWLTARSDGRVHFRPYFPFLVFGTVYLLTLGLLAPRAGAIGHRFISPVCVPLVFCLVAMLQRAGDIINRALKATATEVRNLANACAWIGLVGLLVLHPAVNVRSRFSDMLGRGSWGYHNQRWISSELAAYLRNHPLPGVVYTNDPYAAYLLSGQAFKNAPVYTRQPILSSDNFLGYVGQAHFVWFMGTGEGAYTPDQLRTTYQIEQVVTVSDGSIHSLRTSSPP